jgi:glycosyltransferase involved in cell wall biosynthesis
MKKDIIDLKVDLMGGTCLRGSFSESIRNFARMLHGYVDVALPTWGQQVEEGLLTQEEQEFYGGLSKEQRVPDVNIDFVLPSYYKPRGDTKNVGFVPWGTTKLPTVEINAPSSNMPPSNFNWSFMCNQMDQIWTGSKHGAEAIKASGVDKPPIYYLSGPVDTEKWKPKEEVTGKGILHVTHRPDGTVIPRDERPFTIGYLADWNKRKDIESFLQCAMVSLPSDVVIVLKTSFTHPEASRDKIVNQVVNIKQGLKLPKLPKVIIITDPLRQDDLQDFYSCLDVYVSTSRGEGLNLGLMQAMAMGKLVLASGCGAHMDYVRHGENGFMIPVVHQVAYYKEDGIYGSPVWYQGDQLWGQVNHLELIKLMSTLYSEWGKDRMLGKYKRLRDEARETIVEEHSFNALRPKVLKYLRKLIS